jgi:hypothetical protein
MICDFCKTDYKHEFLERVKIDDGERVILCDDCIEKLKIKNG